MVRELTVALLLLGSGCSLVLDFSDKAIPKDATPDGPFPSAECMLGEPNDTPAQATVVQAGMTGPAAICPPAMGQPEDQDFYKFTVPAGTTSVTVQINFMNRPTGDLDLKLFAADGTTQLAQSRGFGNSETITCPGTSPACAALAPADYEFLVFPAVSGEVNDYDITLTLTGSGSGSGSAAAR